MTTGSPHIDLSVIIIALNEEDNLPRCLASLPAGAEVIVLDSHSTDRTAELSSSFGAIVRQRSFTDFAEQKNAALAFATRSFVLAIDADEELDRDLRSKIVELIAQPQDEVKAWRLPRRLVFMGRQLSYGKTRDWPIRLFLRKHAHYVGSIHEELSVRGQVARIHEGVLWHYSYRDLSDYFIRFTRYTTASASRHLTEGGQVNFLSHILRPWLEFFSRYILRLGFLDGYPGYVYALNSSFYAFIKYAKVLEKKRQDD